MSEPEAVDSAGLDINGFLKEPVYVTSLANRKVRKQLDYIAHYDENVVDKKVSLFNWMLLLSGLGSAGSFCLTLNFADQHPAVFGLVVVGVGAFVFCLVKRLSWGGINLDNERHLAARRVVGMVAADMDPKAPLRTRIDFRDIDHKSKFQRKGEANGWKVQYYEDPWIKLEGRFVDGTAFSVTLTEKYQKRTKWKRSASGKMKHKSKTKRGAQVSLSLKVKAKRYGELSSRQALIEKALELPPAFALKKLSVGENLLSLVLQSKGEQVDADVATRAIAASMLSSYQALNAFKQMEKGAS